MTTTKQTISLVTGAYRGIGFEVTRVLSAAGHKVFLASRNREAATRSAATLQNKECAVSFLELDVTDAGSIRNAVQQVSAQVDHLDVLVNNAAILEDASASVFDLDPAVLERTLITNAVAPLQVTQAFLPLLRRSKGGRIINVSSGAGQLSDMGTWAPAYSISKAALNAVTTQFAAALQSEGIAVNSVCPGWCRTEMGGPTAPRSVEQGADTIVWLATEAPQSLTGKFLRDRQEIPW
jgi:NAD(P)-dependent dehydrogenase (short-subunit alcohol dehydrogenase family)